MDALKISEDVQDKLDNKHFVSRKEVEECLANRMSGVLLEDDREKHRTNPPTQWFLARTNRKRLLKIVFILRGNEVHLKTAYEANADEINIYCTRGGSY